MPFRARALLFRIAAFASFVLVGLPFLVFAQGRFVPQYPEDLVDTGHAAEQRAARAELLAGKTRDAIAHFTQIAAAYEAEGRLQEAAWTYAQIGREDKAHELTEHLLANLSNGTVVSNVAIGIGVTASKRITFEDGSMAIFKNVDYAAEVGAYLVDRFLGLNLIPATVLRDVPGLGRGSVQVWIEGARTVNKFGSYAVTDFTTRITSSDLFFLDVLLDNSDRHSGNYMVREGNYLVAIDQGRTFGYNNWTFRQFATPSNPIPRREVYERLLALDDDTSRAMLKDVLTEGQITRFQDNRRKMISSIEALAAQHGADATFRGEEVFVAKAGAESRSLQKMIRNEDWRALGLRARHSPGFRANLLREFATLKTDTQTKAFAALVSSPAEETALLATPEIRKAAAQNPELLIRAVTSVANDPEVWRGWLQLPGAWTDPAVQRKLMKELKGSPLGDYVMLKLGGPGTEVAAVAEYLFREPSLIPRLFTRWANVPGLPALVTFLEQRGRWEEFLDHAPAELRGSAWEKRSDFLLTLSPAAQVAVLKRLKLAPAELFPFVHAYARNVRLGLSIIEQTGRTDLKILSLPLYLTEGYGYEDWAGFLNQLNELPENRFPEVWTEVFRHLRLNAIAREPAIFARLVEKAGSAAATSELADNAAKYLADPETQAQAVALVHANPDKRGRLARELRDLVSVPVPGRKLRVLFTQIDEAQRFREIIELDPGIDLMSYARNVRDESIVLSTGLKIRLPTGRELYWRDLLAESRDLGLAGKLAGKEKIPALEQANLERLLGIRPHAGWNLRARFAPRDLTPNRCDAVFGGL